jgi:hypothetical protein
MRNGLRSTFSRFVGWIQNTISPRPDKGKRIRATRLVGGATHYVRGQKALGTFQELEFHGFSFVEGPVAVFLDRGKMHEYVLTGGALNEAISFGSIEPFDCSLLFHKHNSFRLIFRLISAASASGEKAVAPAGQRVLLRGKNRHLLATGGRARLPCRAKFQLHCKSINPKCTLRNERRELGIIFRNSAFCKALCFYVETRCCAGAPQASAGKQLK